MLRLFCSGLFCRLPRVLSWRTAMSVLNAQPPFQGTKAVRQGDVCCDRILTQNIGLCCNICGIEQSPGQCHLLFIYFGIQSFRIHLHNATDMPNTNTNPADIDYKRFLPPELHDEVDALIYYLETTPYSQPPYCPYCSSNRMWVNGTGKNGVDTYQCSHCKRCFNPTTDTPLHKQQAHELWPIQTKLMFYGCEKKTVALAMGISFPSVPKREKVIEQVMQLHHQQLYQFWQQYKFALDHFIPAHIEEQIKQFQQWLTPIMQPQKILCPYCHQSKKSLRTDILSNTSYYCLTCGKRFSILNGSPFVKSSYPEKYIPYLTLLLKGLTDIEIYGELSVCQVTTLHWRNIYFEQMRNMGLFELIEWIVWRRIAHEWHVNYLSRQQRNNLKEAGRKKPPNTLT